MNEQGTSLYMTSLQCHATDVAWYGTPKGPKIVLRESLFYC